MADVPVVHEFFMQEALQEARLALQSAEVPVGAVVVVDNVIVGRGHNQRQTLPDPTAHAEMLALRQAAATPGALAAHCGDLVRDARTLYHVPGRGSVESDTLPGLWV